MTLEASLTMRRQILTLLLLLAASVIPALGQLLPDDPSTQQQYVYTHDQGYTSSYSPVVDVIELWTMDNNTGVMTDTNHQFSTGGWSENCCDVVGGSLATSFSGNGQNTCLYAASETQTKGPIVTAYLVNLSTGFLTQEGSYQAGSIDVMGYSAITAVPGYVYVATPTATGNDTLFAFSVSDTCQLTLAHQVTFTARYGAPSFFTGIAAGNGFIIVIDGDNDEAFLFNISFGQLIALPGLVNGSFDATSGSGTISYNCGIGFVVAGGASGSLKIINLSVVNNSLQMTGYPTNLLIGNLIQGQGILYSRNPTLPRLGFSGAYYGYGSPEFEAVNVPVNNGGVPVVAQATQFNSGPTGWQGQITEPSTTGFWVIPENNIASGGYARMHVFLPPMTEITGSPFQSYVSGSQQNLVVDAIAIPAAQCPAPSN